MYRLPCRGAGLGYPAAPFSLSELRRLTIPSELAGATLMRALEQLLPQAHRAALRAQLRTGRILVNRMETQPGQKVREGDLVELQDDPAELPAWRQASGRTLPAILFEDEQVLVVDKPAGMPTVPDRSGREPGVHGLLAELRPDADLRIVHRLDRGTSGCLILAKGLDAARALDRAFRAREVDKRYLALVEGQVHQADFTSEASLGPDRRRPGLVRVVAAGTKGARTAHTEFEVVESFAQHTLLRALPRTGRSHQIRAHLRALGHPIVGDPDYGGSAQLLLSALKPGYKGAPALREPPLLARMFLHAEAVAFDAPGGGGRVAVVAPLPDELARVLVKLRRFTPAGRKR